MTNCKMQLTHHNIKVGHAYVLAMMLEGYL